MTRTAIGARARARQACWPAGRPVVVLLSGGRDSTCLLDLAVADRGRRRGQRAARQLRPARRPPTTTSAIARELCERAGRAARGAPAARRPASGQPAGVGARGALRRGARARARARRRRRRRPHRHRPGRDDPLPAGVLAEPAGAARHARRARARWSGRCSRSRASRRRRTAGAARARPGARTRATRPTRTRATAIRARPRAGAARRPPGGRGATCSRWPRLLRDEAEVLDALVDDVLDGARHGSRSPRCASCPPRCAGWSSSAWPTRRPAGSRPGAARRAEELAALSDRGTAMLDLGVRAAGDRPSTASCGSSRSTARAAPPRRRRCGSRFPARVDVRRAARSAARSPTPAREAGRARPRRARILGAAGPGVAAGRPDARRSASAARSRSRTCSSQRRVPRLERGAVPVVEARRRDRLGGRRRDVRALQGDARRRDTRSGSAAALPDRPAMAISRLRRPTSRSAPWKATTRSGRSSSRPRI